MNDASIRDTATPENPHYHGHIGDICPIEYQGGIVFDAGSGPVLRYFEPWKGEDGPRVTVYTIHIADDVLQGLDWLDLDRIAALVGVGEDEIRLAATSDDPVARACVYEAIGSYCGFVELDQYWEDMSEDEAERIFGASVDAAVEVRR